MIVAFYQSFYQLLPLLSIDSLGLFQSIIQALRNLFSPSKGNADVSKPSKKVVQRNPYECVTLKGEKVKSHGEKDIADFLYYNNIPYKYEDQYPYERNYHPDFHLVGKNIWIEYFGLNRDGSVASFIGGQRASEEYRRQIAWKRKVHTKHGTRLLTFYAYQRSEGDLLVYLRKALYVYGISSRIPPINWNWKRAEDTSSANESSGNSSIHEFNGIVPVESNESIIPEDTRFKREEE